MAATTQPAEVTLRPGERMLAGKVYVFNAELLNEHLAREAVHAEADLKSFTLDHLIGLRAKALRLIYLGDPDYAAASAVSKAINAELARRGLETTGLPRAIASPALMAAE